MEYFILSCSEHTKVLRSSVLSSLAGMAPQKLLTKEITMELDDMNLALLPSEDEERYSDVITSPVYLVSDTVKEIFEKYDHTLVFKAFRIIDKNSKAQLLYWIIGVEEVDCLSEQTEYSPTGVMKKLVVSQGKIGDQVIFKLGGLRKQYLVVRLDVAESLLRRFIYGIELQKIQVEGG